MYSAHTCPLLFHSVLFFIHFFSHTPTLRHYWVNGFHMCSVKSSPMHHVSTLKSATYIKRVALGRDWLMLKGSTPHFCSGNNILYSPVTEWRINYWSIRFTHQFMCESLRSPLCSATMDLSSLTALNTFIQGKWTFNHTLSKDLQNAINPWNYWWFLCGWSYPTINHLETALCFLEH